jgi:hypothetical protein
LWTLRLKLACFDILYICGPSSLEIFSHDILFKYAKASITDKSLTLLYNSLPTNFNLFVQNSDATAPAYISDFRFGISLSSNFNTNLIVKNIFNYAYNEDRAIVAPIRNYTLQFNATF